MSNESTPQAGSVSYGDNASGNIAITGGVQGDVIINRPSAPPLPPPRQLRKPVADFTGREKEVAALLDALRDGGRTGISGISGMGGIGKTELALLVADRLRDDYPDAQLFVEMRGIDERPLAQAEALASCIRAFLGPEAGLPDDVDDLTKLYLSILSSKRALVLLDNAADDEQVRLLIPPQGSALLVTSRLAIKLPGMVRVTLDQLNPEEGSALLRQIAPRVTPETASRICHLCGFLPLAIRAAASLLDTSPDLYPVEYAAQLLEERTRLEKIGAEGVEIGVEASFNLSYTRLNPETARVFRCLAVFRGTFDATAEESVCEDAGHKRLSELVRRSLALYEEKTGRYRLHDLARVFAGSRLSDAERDAGACRHSEHYQRALAEANALYLKGGDEIARGLALFDRERANIESGQAWAAANVESDESAAMLCIAYPDAGAEMFHLRQRPSERIRWLEAMLIAARRLNRRDVERRALGNLGAAYQHRGDIRRAIDFYNQSLDIARETGDRGNEARMLLNIGVAHIDLGEPRDALELYEQALAIFREIGDRRNEGTALGHIGVAYEELGETRRAIECHKQRLVIAREIGDRLGEAVAIANLGRAYYKMGYYRRAIKFYDQQLAIAREIGALREEAHGLHCKAAALYNLGYRRRAIPHLEAALSLYEQIENPQAEDVRTLLSLASRKSHVILSLKEWLKEWLRLLRVSWAVSKRLRKTLRKP
jgi:tetratricopeptide (TPR) repeat protein